MNIHDMIVEQAEIEKGVYPSRNISESILMYEGGNYNLEQGFRPVRSTSYSECEHLVREKRHSIPEELVHEIIDNEILVCQETYKMVGLPGFKYNLKQIESPASDAFWRINQNISRDDLWFFMSLDGRKIQLRHRNGVRFHHFHSFDDSHDCHPEIDAEISLRELATNPEKLYHSKRKYEIWCETINEESIASHDPSSIDYTYSDLERERIAGSNPNWE